MATLKTRWLQSILLVNLSSWCTLAVASLAPAPPSPPECFIPCDEPNCLLHINCTWDPRQEPQIPTNYSLHWEPANSEHGHAISGTSLNGLIHREDFSHHGEVRVWVQAKNQHGSAKSQKVVFNTANIIKPPPPPVIAIHQDQLEIHWTSTCNQLQLSLGTCDVRHRAEADQVWPEWENGFHSSYTFFDHQPCTVFEFQVRCACGTGLPSDWSAIQRIQGTETTPVGELDIWRDCEISNETMNCILMWKRLPMHRACGFILGYEVRLYYNNNTVELVNVSMAKPEGRLDCNETQCRFTSSLKNASSISVSAYNAHGATEPSKLVMPISGKDENEQAIDLKMNEENLTVSWDLPSQLSDNLTEYVVQYKQAGCPPDQAFEWIKVNKSQTTAFFKGQFKKYKPYRVSLFAVLNSGEVHHLSSRIEYSFQKTPSRVPSFQVSSIAATHVTLLWEDVPLCKQYGVILYYQIGVDGQKVYNASAHENKTFKLPHLSPGQEYEVWIRAVNVAGPGENATTRFETQEKFAYVPVILGIISLFVCVCFFCVIFSPCRSEKSCAWGPQCDKVPDPRNSHIFRDMNHQINDPKSWICVPTFNEPHPEISLLEVVEIPLKASKSSLEKTSDADELSRPLVRKGSSQMDCQDDQRDDVVIEENHRTDHKYGRQAYSKMVDSDEDKEDGWSSEEDQCKSGYEKHFMPTPLEILEVL